MYVASGISTFILKSMKSHKWSVPELSLDQIFLSYKDHSGCMKRTCGKIAKVGDKKPFKRREFRQKVEADESLREDLFYSSFHYNNSFKSFQYQSVARQTPLSMEFSRQEYWSWFLSPGDLLDPRIEPTSPVLQENPLGNESQGSPKGQPCPNSNLNPGPSD